MFRTSLLLPLMMHSAFWHFFLQLLLLFLNASCSFCSGLQVPGISKSLIAGILIARYIVLPLIGIAIVKVALQLGFVNNNPLYQFVLLLQFAVPPAMNIGMFCCILTLFVILTSYLWLKNCGGLKMPI